MEKKIAAKKTGAIQNADIVCDIEQRQYHIALAPNDIAKTGYIMLVGDPERAVKASKLLDSISMQQKNREFYSFTGKYQGIEITILSTGIGTDNTEIALIELFQITRNPTFIRIGTCGALQKNIKLGDFVISRGALRLELTSLFYVNEGYPAIADHEINLALMHACEKHNFKYHLGITGTAAGFYGAQGREIPGIPLRYPNLLDDMTKMNVANFEMESSTLFTLASLKNFRASTLCLAIATRNEGEFVDPEKKQQGEKNSLIAGFEAFKNLAKIDAIKIKKGNKYWLPSIN